MILDIYYNEKGHTVNRVIDRVEEFLIKYDEKRVDDFLEDYEANCKYGFDDLSSKPGGSKVNFKLLKFDRNGECTILLEKNVKAYLLNDQGKTLKSL